MTQVTYRKHIELGEINCGKCDRAYKLKKNGDPSLHFIRHVRSCQHVMPGDEIVMVDIGEPEVIVIEAVDCNEDCSICFENMTSSQLANTPCGHHFHRTCVEKMTNDNCPLCRRPMGINRTEPPNESILEQRNRAYREASDRIRRERQEEFIQRQEEIARRLAENDARVMAERERNREMITRRQEEFIQRQEEIARRLAEHEANHARAMAEAERLRERIIQRRVDAHPVMERVNNIAQTARAELQAQEPVPVRRSVFSTILDSLFPTRYSRV